MRSLITVGTFLERAEKYKEFEISSDEEGASFTIGETMLSIKFTKVTGKRYSPASLTFYNDFGWFRIGKISLLKYSQEEEYDKYEFGCFEENGKCQEAISKYVVKCSPKY